MNSLHVPFALVAVQTLFGTLPLGGQIAMRGGLGPFGVAALRIGGAAVVLGIVAGRRLGSVQAADFPALALYSFLGIVGNQMLFLEGLSRTTQINAAILITTIPVFTVGFALMLGRERASIGKLAGIATGLAGALALAGVERFDLSDRTFVGNLMIIVNSSFWSLYLVLARPMLQRVDPLVMTAWLFLLGSLAALPAGMGDVASAVGVAGWKAWTAGAWVVLGPTVGAYLLSVWALKRAESSAVAVFTYLQPLVAGVLAWAFAGERLSPRTGIAAVAIFAGVAMVQWDALRRSGRSGEA